MKQALVLSGGGAKGAYQIGVWKALRKMKIQIDIVTGTSVGALNGAMIVQKDYRNAKKLWKNMNFQLVFDEDVVEKYNDCKTTKDLLEMFSHSFFKNGGMKIQQLETIVKRYFRPHNFFASEIDYGISTYNFSKMQVEKRTKKEMNKENAPDYIVASSCCFPAFQMKKIKKDKYIDGGYADYIPLNLAIDLGAEEIIAVDLHAPGIKEKIKNKKIPITYIEPNNTIGGFLNFNKENAKTAMRFGYLDTMKVFHKFEGKRYTFKKNTLVKCQKKYNELLVNYLNQIFDFHENKTTMEELLTLATYKRMISMKKNNTETIFLDILENLASIFNLPENKIYSSFTFHRKIHKLLKKAPNIQEDILRKEGKKTSITSYLNRQSIIRYFYIKIEEVLKDSSLKKKLCKMALVFPKEFLDALYLYTVQSKEWWIL